MSYCGWDVHANTGQFRQALDEKSWRQWIPPRLEPELHARLVWDLKARYGADRVCLASIDKMARRYRPEIGGYMDPDLHVNVTSVLWMTWNTVKCVDDASIYAGFGEILRDIGTTCIQGDSHRLLSYWIALSESVSE